MKKLSKFLISHPGYCKSPVITIARYSGVAESTIIRFKKTEEFRLIKKLVSNNA